MTSQRRAARPGSAPSGRHQAPVTRRHAARSSRARLSGSLRRLFALDGPAGTANRRLRRRLAVTATITTVGLGILAAPALVGSVYDEGEGFGPIAEVPGDNPRLGLVYQGLEPADEGSPCVGAYQLDDPEMCSHGPDEAPAGLDVKRDVAPIARTSPVATLPRRDTSAAPRQRDVLADAGARAPTESTPALAPAAATDDAPVTIGPNGVTCEADGQSGKRIQVLYVYQAGTASRFSQYLASFRAWTAGVDAIFDSSAKQTGGSRRLRFVTTTDCQVDVREVQVPAGALANFNTNISALKKLGFNRTDRKYVLFADAKVYCGIGSFVKDDIAGASNRNNRGPSYGRSDSGCWAASVAAHELAHNLGGVQDTAPNASGAGHCVDDYDVMCYKDADETVMKVACAERANEQRLDCGHDDYFHTDPKPGSYLATHWNVANSEYLVDGAAGTDGGDGPAPTTAPTRPPAGPTTPPEPTATAAPEPTATAAPEPSGSPAPDPTDAPVAPAEATDAPPEPLAPPPAPAPGRPDAETDPAPLVAGKQVTGKLVTSAVTSTAAQLSWPPAARGTRYVVVVDGRALGSTTTTRIRVIGLRPDNSYQMHISVRGADRALNDHTRTVTVRTATAERPAAGRWFAFSNALTGGAAQLYASRSADNTPLVLGGSDGAADQVWQLREVADGRHLLRSKATGKCVSPLGSVVAGAVLVQRACEADNVAQHWRLTGSTYGFTVTTAQAGLVIGVSRLRYGDQRLLVLQRAGTARYQSWSAPPA